MPRLLTLLLAFVLGCGGDVRSDSVLLWHAYTGAEQDALRAAIERIESEQGVKIRLVSVPYEAFADKLTAAIPNGNGPDLFVFAHDRIGHWTANQLIEPLEYYVDPTIADRYALEALSAMSFEGSLYGLPLTVKSLALYYRTDILEVPPTETDQFFAMDSLYSNDWKGYPLVYENTNLYPQALWLHGFGGSLFDREGNRISLATPEAVAALSFARKLDRDKVVPGGIDSRMVATLFNEGKAAMAISGPWFQNDINEGVPWAVATLPKVSDTGLAAKPFLGVEGILMSSRAKNKDRAFRVLEELTNDTAAIERAKTAKQIVANVAAYEDKSLSSNATLMAFRKQLDSTVPMSASLLMRSVWTPYQNALLKVIDQGDDAADALRAAESEVQSYSEGQQ